MSRRSKCQNAGTALRIFQGRYVETTHVGFAPNRAVELCQAWIVSILSKEHLSLRLDGTYVRLPPRIISPHAGVAI